MNTEDLDQSISEAQNKADYFVENEGYATLAGVREDIDVAFRYGTFDMDDAEQYLERGDTLITNLEELGDDPEKRKHVVEMAIDHYRKAVDEMGHDKDYFNEWLDTARTSIFAGIESEIRSEEKESSFSPEDNGLVGYNAE